MNSDKQESFRNIMINMAAEDPSIEKMIKLAVAGSNVESDDYDMTARFAELAGPVLRGYCLTELPLDSEAVFQRFVDSQKSAG